MIAASTISDAVPQVRFPVAWPVAVANDAGEILDSLQHGVTVCWEHIAPVVEIARTNGTAGLLRVTLEATAAIATTYHDGETWMMANAQAVWADEPPPASLLAELSPDELADTRKPPTEHAVTLVLAVLADDARIRVERVYSPDPHGKYLAAAVERDPNYRDKPCKVVALSELRGAQ